MFLLNKFSYSPITLICFIFFFISCEVTDKGSSTVQSDDHQSIISKLKTYDNFSSNAYTKNNPEGMEMSSTWDWEENKRHTLYLIDGSSIEKSLPYYDSSSPAWDDIRDDEVLRSDGWRLLYKDFGSAEEGISTPFFSLYNIFTGGVKVFFYNANLTENYTKALVKITTDYQGSGDSNYPSILNFYNDYYYDTHEYIEAYAPTEITPNEWSYFDFKITGYDPDIGSGKYKDEVIDMELIAFNESQIDLEGQINLQPVYDPGQANILSKVENSLDQITSGEELVSDLLNDYDEVDKSNEDLEDQAQDEGNDEVISTISEFGSMAFSEYLPALSQISGFVNKLVGGTSSGSLTRYAGPITLSGTSTTQFSNLANLFIRIPGAERSNDIAAPVYDSPTGIFSLEDEILTTRSNYSERCRDDYYRRDCYSQWVVTIDEIDLSINPVIEDKGFDIQIKAAKIVNGTNETDYKPYSYFIGESDACYEDPNSRCPGKALTIKAIIDNNDSNFIPVEYFKTYSYRN